MSTPSRPEFDASKKADELFFDWFTRPTTQDLLIDHLSILLADDDEAKGGDKAPATPPLAPPSPTMPSPPQSPTSPRDSPPPGIASSPRSPRSVVGDVSPRFTRKKSVEARKMNARRARRSAAAATEASKGKAINLPRFYYRNGRPKDDEEKAAEIEREIERVFRRFGGRISREDFPSVVKVFFWGNPIFFRLISSIYFLGLRAAALLESAAFRRVRRRRSSARDVRNVREDLETVCRVKSEIFKFF